MQDRNLNGIIKLYLFFLLLSKMNVGFSEDFVELFSPLTEEEWLEQDFQKSLFDGELVYGTFLFDPPKERSNLSCPPITVENIHPKGAFEERLKTMNFIEQEEE